MYKVEPDPQTETTSPQAGGRARKAWRIIRAPLVGLILGIGFVKGLDRWRISRLTPDERQTEAHAHCERASEISREACGRLGVGPIYLPKSVISDMIREYSRALEIDPGHLEALHDRAYWRAYSDQEKAARQDYDELIRRDPQNDLAWYQRARLRCGGGDHAGALAVLNL
ncbi:MAG: hypothetical protein AAB074_18340 [Planctomycetota bacterium]